MGGMPGHGYGTTVQVLRAIIKTFGLGDSPEQMRHAADTVDALFIMCDPSHVREGTRVGVGRMGVGRMGVGVRVCMCAVVAVSTTRELA